MSEVAKEKTVNVAVIERQITDQVLEKINSFQANNELLLPKDYSPENALKSAFLILTDLKNKDNKPALEVCSKTSIANSLLKMVVEGLSPMKKQCYFIPYGTELQCSRSYQGSMALAKRVGGVKDVIANVIYEKDTFEFSLDLETGRKKIDKHTLSLQNIDNDKIVGAYAVVLYNDGSKDLEVMTIKEIRTAWNQGQMKGNSGAHNNFTQEMCKKTVIGRACKTPINSSNDGSLYEDSENKPLEIETQNESKTVDFSSVPEATIIVEEKPIKKVEAAEIETPKEPGF